MRNFDYLHSICKKNEDIYFTARGMSGIFQLNTATKNMACLTDKIEVSDFCPDKSIAVFEDFLVLFPLKSGNCIEIYSIANRSVVKSIALNNEHMFYFDNYFIRDNLLYAVNNWSESPSIVVVNMNSLEIEKELLFDSDCLWGHKEKGRPFANDFVVRDEILYMAAGHCLVKVSLSDDSITLIDINCSIKDFISICIVDNCFWFTDKDSNVICWEDGEITAKYSIRNIFSEISSNFIEEECNYRNQVRGYAESYQYYNHTFLLGDYIFWVPGRASHIVCFHTKLDKWELRQSFESKDFLPEDGGHSFINFCSNPGKEAVVFLVDEGLFAIMDQEGNLNKLLCKGIGNVTIELEGILTESNLITCDLKSFLSNKYIVKNDK